MFEAQLTDGKTFKSIIEAIKDLVQDCNLDVSEEEMAIQSMDSAHVSLVAIRLSSAGFETYRCDRPNSLGINTGNMAKILKMLGKDDSITFKAEDDKPDTLTMLFEGGKNTIADFGKSHNTEKVISVQRYKRFIDCLEFKGPLNHIQNSRKMSNAFVPLLIFVLTSFYAMIQI
jgi:proliferating cell nuclear antigen PCNA